MNKKQFRESLEIFDDLSMDTEYLEDDILEFLQDKGYQLKVISENGFNLDDIYIVSSASQNHEIYKDGELLGDVHTAHGKYYLFFRKDMNQDFYYSGKYIDEFEEDFTRFVSYFDEDENIED